MRIIAGRLRGSKLPVPDRPGLRPTGDRARETLFNWLQGAIPGRRVLDLFAGSGALGFEAASRGAALVEMVELDPGLAASLGGSAARLGVQDLVRVYCEDALRWLRRPPDRAFDLVFVDPPYADATWEAVLAALPPWLSPLAWVHVESAAGVAPAVPTGWHLHRSLATREARHALYRVESRPAPGQAATLATAPSAPGMPKA